MKGAAAIFILFSAAISASAGPAKRTPPTLHASTHNLLLEAKLSGNLESFRKGIRGVPDHVVYDPVRRAFAKPSQYHEYGVGFQQDLGVVAEQRPAYWMAEWTRPVEANLIVLSGVYPNQPQRDTAWKIELRRGGRWTVHARGVGGWYDRGRYVWGGPGTEPRRFDALRVSVFSKDETTPLRSIHFRGEPGVSWIVAKVAPIDACILGPSVPGRAGRAVRFSALPLAGKITSWNWDFGDGTTASGRTVEHAYRNPGEYTVKLTFSDGRHAVDMEEKVAVGPPIEVQIHPLDRAVMVGRPVDFVAKATLGTPDRFDWDFGDGHTVQGAKVRHTYDKPGIYRVQVTATDGSFSDRCVAIVRAHTPDTVRIPQVFLDTDQKNEQDDQHYFGYALFSELDLLGVNSVHHGGGQEPINYGEILHVLDLAKQSGLPQNRVPFVFHGANKRLMVPPSGKWQDTHPIITEAGEAIVAAARGASPSNPVWVVPVGPGTNVASAILQARAEGLELRERLRVMWLGGSNKDIINEFNGHNDPWSIYVIAQSGLEVWFMPAPVGARVAIDKRTEGYRYADNPLGRYLKKIVPARHKPLFDPSCLSAIISMYRNLGWIKQVERVTVAGPDEGYRLVKSDAPNAVRVIRQIEQDAMKSDIFDTMKGKPTRLIGQ